MRRLRRFAPWLALLLLAPTALADHSFSHRIYVSGRVIDADGRPAAGVPVALTFANLSAGGLCFESKEEITGPQGDYEICRHAHVIPANASVTIRARNATRTVPVDPDLRQASANLQVDREVAHDVAGERTFPREYAVHGASFSLLPTPTSEEGIVVNATPATVNVTVFLAQGIRILAMANVSPNERGRFHATLPVEEIPDGSVVRVRGGLAVTEEIASALYRRSDVGLAHDLRLFDGPGDDAPGSRTPLPAWIAIAAMALALSAGASRGRSRGRG